MENHIVLFEFKGFNRVKLNFNLTRLSLESKKNVASKCMCYELQGYGE